MTALARALVGAWMGAVAVFLGVIAYNASFEAATLGGGKHLRAEAIFAMAGAAAFVGFLLGALLGAASFLRGVLRQYQENAPD